MKSRIPTTFVALLSLVASLTSPLQAESFKTVLFEDDFSGTELKKEWGSWKS